MLTAACGGKSSSVPAGTACRDLVAFTGSVDDRRSAPASGSSADLQSGDIFFAPTCVTGASGTMTLKLTNSGRILHNISVPDQGIDVDLPVGQTMTVQVKVGSKPIVFFCKYHKDAGQQGALIPSSP